MAFHNDFTRKMERILGRSLLEYQLLLAGIAIASLIVFWFLQGTADAVNTLLYTFIIGNFNAVALTASSRWLRIASPLRGWIVFVVLLSAIGTAGGTLASLVIYALHPAVRGVSLHSFLLVNVRIGLFITVITGIPLFISNRTRERFQAANQQLQVQVQLGAIELQDQATELTSAHEIQAHLLPTNLPQLPGVQVSGAWQPARAVGGDYFDVLSFDQKRLGLCIADVSGKGMGAALLMANLQAAFRAFATEDRQPGALCQQLNRALCASIAPAKFVTFFYGLLDMPKLTFSYANAGHNPPLLLRGDAVISLDGGGVVLGLFPDAEYAERTLFAAARRLPPAHYGWDHRGLQPSQSRRRVRRDASGTLCATRIPGRSTQCAQPHSGGRHPVLRRQFQR